jgi:antitoxin VapB
MALNLKNAEVERLAAEIARMTGESKTEAVRRALEERRRRLAYRTEAAGGVSRGRRYLEEDVWPLVPDEQRGRTLTREEEDAILGYGPQGV